MRKTNFCVRIVYVLTYQLLLTEVSEHSMNIFKKIGLLNGIFILIATGICMMVIIPTFGGQFNSVYEKECINKLQLYSALTADNIEKKCTHDNAVDFKDARGQIVSLMSKVDEPSPISYTLYSVDGKNAFKVVENDVLKDDTPVTLPYIDFILKNNTQMYHTPIEQTPEITRVNYTALPDNTYKSERYISASPIFCGKTVTGIVEISMTDDNYKAVVKKITFFICGGYAIVLVIVFISMMKICIRQIKEENGSEK